MEMSFLLFIGFASRAKQGHPEQKENNGANGILKLVNKNLTLQFQWTMSDMAKYKGTEI